MFGTEDLTGHIGKAFDRGVRAYRDDPAGFVRDCIVWGDGKGPAPYQLANLQSLVEHQRIAVRGPRGLGKTTTHAWVILWFALTRDACREDWKCIVTAGAWGQLVNFLWPEVKTKWTPRLDWERIGRKPFGPLEMMQRELRLSFGAVTMGAPTDAAKIEGAHADELLYVLDEAKSIPDDTWRSIEGAFSGAGADTEQTGYAIASSTPSAPEGYFYDIHAGAPGLQSWHAIHVTREQALGAKRMSVEWAQQQAEYFGEDSAWYRNHVEGEFATQESDSVIRMVDLEAAHERWRALNLPWSSSSTRVLVPAHDVLEQLDVVGVDVSRGGGDKTVYALRHGEVISTLVWRPREPDTTVCAREVASLLRVPERPAVAVVDANGVGGPVADMLRKDGCRAVDFVAQEKTSMKVRTTRQSFVDTRAGAWWNLRELLEPGSGFELAIPPDDQLTADLLAPTWKEEANGRIRVESKDGIRGRLKRSTDAGDSVVQAYWTVKSAPMGRPPEVLRRPGGSRNAPFRQRAGAGMGH